MSGALTRLLADRILRGDRLNLSDVGFACRSMTERCHRGVLARIFGEFLRYI
jgi:hypothetical protein